ncbi:MAG: cyanophycin synthetase, partial [Gemmatimonadetes bacterium]|nr:cyanophycin synthetase [Gemmatimonadota bacterium]
MSRPDSESEIRPTALRTVQGANFWSRRPVTRMDLAVGAYDEISSADVSGFKGRLHRAMPGLVEHRCSIGERGGFLTRLEQGTYAPHIIEHVALELQVMIGHDVGYGKTRGGDVPGEYTLVFEHLHPAVGLRAATLALDIVRRAFAGTLDGVGDEVEQLRAIAETLNPPPSDRHASVAITGGSGREEACGEL